MTDNTSAAEAGNSAKIDFMDNILGKEKEAEVVDVAEEDGKSEAPKKDEGNKEEGESEPEKKVLVPHGAFHEERERRKELQSQLKEEKAARERLEERQNKILEALAARQQPQQEESFIDPLARIENKVNEVVERVNRKAEAETEDAKAIREENELVQKYSASAQAFSKDSPDFTEAYNYLLSSRTRELQTMGLTLTEINAQLRAEEKNIVSRAYQGEKNPAEVVYTLAKERGYKPIATDKGPKKTVEDIDRGLKASKSLGSGGAKSGDKDDLESLSATDLADMTQEEFNSFFNKLEKQAGRKH